MKITSRKFFQRRNLFGATGRAWQGGLLLGMAAMGGLAAAIVGSPFFGLSLFTGLFGASLGCASWRRANQKFRVQQDSIPFFWGVVALLRAGVAFPTAIGEMAQRLDNSFTVRLRQRLEGYRRGVSLSSCLRRFQREPLGEDVGVILNLLEQCQRRGMPCLPLLESALPQWEESLSFKSRIADVRRGVLAQGVVAALLPWSLWAFCYVGDFGFAEAVTVDQLRPALILGLILQLSGFTVLWRMSCFHE